MTHPHSRFILKKGSPVGDEQSMRVVVSTGNTLQMTCRHKFSGHYACTSLDALSAIVGELHLLLIELDTVTEDAEHRTRTHDV